MVVPQFLGRPEYIDQLEQLALEMHAEFHEVVLMDDKEVALRRFTDRTRAALDPTHVEAQEMLDRAAGLDELDAMYDRLVAMLTTRPARDRRSRRRQRRSGVPRLHPRHLHLFAHKPTAYRVAHSVPVTRMGGLGTNSGCWKRLVGHRGWPRLKLRGCVLFLDTYDRSLSMSAFGNECARSEPVPPIGADARSPTRADPTETRTE